MKRLDRFLIIIWSLCDKEIYVVINKIDSEKIFRPASVNIPPVLVFLSVATFIQGAVNTSIQASFQSNCCHPKVVFVGLDLVGNMGTCSVSLVPDIVAFGAKPNTTAVSLRSEETTRVPFTLTNLGSRGSFSFHVTKAASLISYVIPFSLALDANASAAGHVVISSLIDTNTLENLTVTAVAQSDTVNNKEVTLFDIQVSVLSETQPTTPFTTPATTPFTTPATTPFTTPATTLFTTPATTSATTPFTTPATAPATTPFTTPATTPFTTPATTLFTTPATTSATTPFTTPATAPATTPFTTPATTLFTTPATTSATTPATTSATAPATTLFTTPATTSATAPATTPFTTPATTPFTTPATTPALKQIRLEAVAPKSHQSIKPGARLELNFSVTNLAAVKTFTFNVRLLPRMVFLCYLFCLASQ